MGPLEKPNKLCEKLHKHEREAQCVSLPVPICRTNCNYPNKFGYICLERLVSDTFSRRPTSSDSCRGGIRKEGSSPDRFKQSVARYLASGKTRERKNHGGWDYYYYDEDDLDLSSSLMAQLIPIWTRIYWRGAPWALDGKFRMLVLVPSEHRTAPLRAVASLRGTLLVFFPS